MTPPIRFRFLTGEHSTESPEKSYVLAGASHKPYGMNEPFPIQQTNRKLAAGRRGHDPALHPVKHQFAGQLRKSDQHITHYSTYRNFVYIFDRILYWNLAL